MITNKIRLAVVGSRSIIDKQKVFSVLEKNLDKIDYIISGGAEGPDSFAQEFCQENGLPIKIYYPKWYDENGQYIKAAGFFRNKNIIEESDMVLAFWDKESKGTANDIDLAKKLNKQLVVVECENPLKDYYIFAASTSLLSPFNILKFKDKDKNLEFESVYQGYCWYFSKFINNQNLQNAALNHKYRKDFEGVIASGLIGDKWAEWKNIEPKILKYLYKLKGIVSKRFLNELSNTKDKNIIFSNLDSILGCGKKRNEITPDLLGDGENQIGKALMVLRSEIK